VPPARSLDVARAAQIVLVSMLRKFTLHICTDPAYPVVVRACSIKLSCVLTTR
jgi:hypothetical protein